MIVFYDGPPRISDLNFMSRVFGKSGRPGDENAMRDATPRAIVGGSVEHFRAASRAWLLGLPRYKAVG